MNNRMWLMVSWVALELIAALMPGWKTLLCLLIGIFVVVHFIPEFRCHASMYVLIATYVLTILPVLRIVMEWLRINWRVRILLMEYFIDFDRLAWKDIIIIGGVVLFMVYCMAVFCAYLAGLIWRQQDTLPEQECD